MPHLTSRIRFSALLLLFVALVEIAPVQAGESNATAPSATAQGALYEICRAQTSVQAGGKYTTYFSGIMRRANINDSDYSAAFAAFLAKKYGLQYVTPECGSARSAAEAQSWTETGWWAVNPYHSVAVRSGWTYSGGGSAASSPQASAPPNRPAPAVAAARHSAAQAPNGAAAAPAVPANAGADAPPGRYGVCYASYDPHSAYFSAEFKVADRQTFKWEQAFGSYLQKRYHYGAAAACDGLNSLAEAQSDLKRLVDTFGPHKNIVMTGWQYQ